MFEVAGIGGPPMSPLREGSRPQRARRHALHALVAVAIAAGGTVLGAGAAFAEEAITASPATGLVTGQTVTVHGTGWVPLHFIAYCQAVPTTSPSPGDCSGGSYATTVADEAGTFTVSVVVKRSISVPDLGRTVDCADPADPCAIGAADIENGFPGTAAFATLEFAPQPPTVVPGAASVPEGNSATTNLAVPVTLSFPSTDTVTVEWRTAFVAGDPMPAGRADPASDFTPASGTVTFVPGDTDETATISVNGDLLVEPDEFIGVVFHDATNAAIGGYYGIGVGKIADDDRATVLPGAASVAEGNAGTVDLVLPLTLSKPSSATVMVQWTTAFAAGAPAGQADPATDFTPVSGTVTFAPGDTAEAVTISINGDGLVEPDEYLLVSFNHPINAVMGGYYGLGFGKILNDD
jgi:hypothetical protein